MPANHLATDLPHILHHTQDLWEELRGQRLFITGGTGFFGCWLLESFTYANDQLNMKAVATVLTRDPEAFRHKAPHLANHPALEFTIGDVRDFTFPPGTYSHIIHGATEAKVQLNQEQPLLMFDTILEGTRRVLEFARQCGAEKLLLTSSGAVYGPQPPELTHMPEDYPGAPDTIDPQSAYGEGKRAAEMLGTLYSREYGLQVKIARCFAFVGPYLPLGGAFAVGNFIRDGLKGGPIQVMGDGSPYRSYLYAADLTIWLWHILQKGQPARPYNVGSDVAISIADLARAVAAATMPVPDVHIARTPVPGRPPERYVPSIRRARTELQLEPWIGLEQALEKTFSWHHKNDRR